MSRHHRMESTLGQGESPAGKLMDEAIGLAIDEESPYPEQALFLDANTPHADREMKRAAREGYSIVLVSPDGDVQIVAPEEVVPLAEIGAPTTASPARRPEC